VIGIISSLILNVAICGCDPLSLINLFEMSLKMIERVPLSKLQIIEEMPSPLQRKAKIYSRRLP